MESVDNSAGQKSFLKIQRKTSRVAKKSNQAQKSAKSAISPAKNDEEP